MKKPIRFFLLFTMLAFACDQVQAGKTWKVNFNSLSESTISGMFSSVTGDWRVLELSKSNRVFAPTRLDPSYRGDYVALFNEAENVRDCSLRVRVRIEKLDIVPEAQSVGVEIERFNIPS